MAYFFETLEIIVEIDEFEILSMKFRTHTIEMTFEKIISEKPIFILCETIFEKYSEFSTTFFLNHSKIFCFKLTLTMTMSIPRFLLIVR